MNKIEYIGLLDSGVGGLSVLKELKKLMPEKNYIFFGDTKNIPYGTKNADEIYGFTKNILNFFVSKNVKYVVIACNTTSATVYDKLKNEFNQKLTIVPLIQSTAPYAAEGLEENDELAVFATKATVNSHKYSEEIKKYNSKIKVREIDCSGFVEIVENRLYNDQNSIELIKEKLKIAQHAKRIVLGCTHYPYLVEIFKKYSNAQWFDPAKSVAKVAKDIIKNNAQGTKEEFFVSSNPSEFEKSAEFFYKVQNTQLINLDLT
ncbi:glutamate racemase [bacterium]|nr:glutamate racemase [bacterium]